MGSKAHGGTGSFPREDMVRENGLVVAGMTWEFSDDESFKVGSDGTVGWGT